MEKKEAMGLVYSVKEVLAHLSVYGFREDRDDRDKQIDRGIRSLERLDEFLCSEKSFETETVTQLKESEDEWVRINGGILPGEHEDVLFSTISEQVFEGFLETRDVTSPYIKDGKIGFKRFEDGGKWFRYRFRDYLDMNLVVAWRYKPAAFPYENRRNKRRKTNE